MSYFSVRGAGHSWGGDRGGASGGVWRHSGWIVMQRQQNKVGKVVALFWHKAERGRWELIFVFFFPVITYGTIKPI